jgi:hypothetical protein
MRSRVLSLLMSLLMAGVSVTPALAHAEKEGKKQVELMQGCGACPESLGVSS